MRETNRIIRTISVLVLLPVLFSACGKFDSKLSDGKQPDSTFQFASYRDIPGVTQDEIKAIEALRGRYDHFAFGMIPSTEAFYDDDGNVKGFDALFCRWLTRLFGIPFIPEIDVFNELLAKLARNEVDFTGSLSATEERQKIYSMTSPIALHTIQYFRIDGSPSLESIAARRPLRYVFMGGGAATIRLVTEKLEPGTYEIVISTDIDEVYRMLKSGEVDAHFNANRESAFDVYGDVVSNDFIPLIYTSASFTAQNPELSPIISVMQKAIDNGALQYLAELHNAGYQEYLKHKLSLRLSEEERAYIKEHPLVPFTTSTTNYPVSFYNAHEEQWQGVFFDILREIEALTGLSFERVNDENTPLSDMLEILEDGRASMMTELMHSAERAKKFIWSKTVLMTDYPALISRMDYHNISLNEILYTKVGLIAGSAQMSMFLEWFPNHHYIKEYQNRNAAFDALDNGEVDMIMLRTHDILMLTNFMERTNFKTNYIFNDPVNISFAFNKDEVILCSILDKAFRLIDTDKIVDQWTNRTYDYNSNLIKAQRSWFIGSSILFFSALALVTVLLLRNRRTGKQLEMQTALITSLFDSIPDLIFAKDMNSRFIQCNKSFLEHFACEKKDTIGKNDVEAFGMPVEIMEKYHELDRQVMNERKVFIREEIIPCFDGTTPIFETIKSPLVLNGAVIGLLAISRNIVAQKKAQEEVLAASRAKGVFLATMSHEIRTPLNAIIGMSYILKDCVSNNEKALRSVDQIMTSSHHLLGILNDILDMSKIESGKLELTREPFSLLKACGEVSNIMTHRCVEKNITFVTNIHELKDVTLTGDKLRLNQVLINLLGNAVKFTDTSGEIKFITEILGSTHEENTEKAHVKFSVSDNGIGMSEEQIKKLFIPFEQADTTIAARFGGTGLGLSLSQNFVNMMGGEISVKSELDKGSTFEFSLFFDKCELPVSQAEDEKHENLNLKGKRMLLAEDIEINRLIINELLSPSGISIDEAENGRQAVGMFNSSPQGYYDIILMDIQMPVLNGYDAAKEIRVLDRADAGTVLIVAMTANAFKEDIEQALSAGMNGHLAKPVDRDALMETVGKIMKDRNE